MKVNDLLDAIGRIDDEYVQDAKAVRVVRKRHPWLKWSAMAACACILVYLGIQSSFLGGHGESTTANDAGGSMNGGSGQHSLIAEGTGSTGPESYDSYESSKTASNDMAVGESSQETENMQENQCSYYPYNDKLVLDYVGIELENIRMADGTVVFNEITDIEMYRELNNLSVQQDTVYYDTKDSLYYYLSAEEDTKYFTDRAVDDLASGNTEDRDNQETCKQDNQDRANIAGYLLEESRLGNVVEGAISDSMETIAWKNYVADSPDGQVTILASKDLDALGSRMQAFVAPMRKKLGTEQGTLISGQEAVVQYFYQQRMLNEEIVEESYQYYAYFEKGDVEYLYQYSSNWTLPGEAATAIHNPPYTISEAISQEASREMFVEILINLMELAAGQEE